MMVKYWPRFCPKRKYKIMFKKLLSCSLLLVFACNLFAEGWRRFPSNNNHQNRYPTQYNRPSRDRYPQHYNNRPNYNRYPVYNNYNRYPVYNNYNRYPVYNNYNRSGRGISTGAATAIGLGVGILGFAIGRSTKNKDKVIVYQDQKDQKIQCKDFDIKVTIDGEEKKAKITKCKTESGDWEIPEID